MYRTFGCQVEDGEGSRWFCSGFRFKYKPEGNDQRVNFDTKGMIAFLPLPIPAIPAISNNKYTEQGWEQTRHDNNNVCLDLICLLDKSIGFLRFVVHF